ncbi:hypothetical protein AX17_006697 [Amanita inopinata Kibby_2008]|nr:hypothetical protein AX17_006697 [Amanita inopinata Kibby_2008]
MSLSSFLLSKAKTRDAGEAGQVVDKELDELFKSKTHAVAVNTKDQEGSGSGVVVGKKRKKVEVGLSGENKRARRDRDGDGGEDGPDTNDDDDASNHLQDEETSSENDTTTAAAKAPPIHESLLSSKKSKSKSKSQLKPKKYVPPGETPLERDLRTVFIGNLSVEVAKKRPLQKQLRRHLLASAPTAKIESVRFRSVPFQAPTNAATGAPSSSPTDDAKSKSKSKSKSEGQAREHDRTRAAAWRHAHDSGGGDAAAAPDDEKQKYLTPSQKKKLAFIHHEFHPVADTVHAYAVFAHPVPAPTPDPSSPSPSDGEGEGEDEDEDEDEDDTALESHTKRPQKQVMDPYEAARIVARECDGTTFLDRMLRVDVVGRSTEKGGRSVGGLQAADPKRSVFVGNLDFASREEDLRVFFEGVVSKERGSPPPVEDEDESENESEGEERTGVTEKPRSWVTRVRIVRDRDTQLGKGFAYVQFADRECVDEILAIETGKLVFAKRKLRVQRCKTVPGSTVPTRHLTTKGNAKASPSSLLSSSAHTQSRHSQTERKSVRDQSNKHSTINRTTPSSSSSSSRIVVPKGDPKLGEKLAHLSKQERKQAKAADADRIARRLAKKKARMAMGSKDRDQALPTTDKNDGGGREGKRVRVRKDRAGVGKSVGGKKTRMKSEKSLAKLNTKK